MAVSKKSPHAGKATPPKHEIGIWLARKKTNAHFGRCFQPSCNSVSARSGEPPKPWRNTTAAEAADAVGARMTDARGDMTEDDMTERWAPTQKQRTGPARAKGKCVCVCVCVCVLFAEMPPSCLTRMLRPMVLAPHGIAPPQPARLACGSARVRSPLSLTMRSQNALLAEDWQSHWMEVM